MAKPHGMLAHRGAIMKKLIAILIVCLSFYSADARNLMVVGGGVPVAGGSNGVIGATSYIGTWALYGAAYYEMEYKTPTTAGNVRYGHVYVKDSNGDTLYLRIHTADGSDVLLCCSGTIADGTAGWVNCDAGSSTTLVSETTYIISVQSVGGGLASVGSSHTADFPQTFQWSNDWASGYDTCPGLDIIIGAVTSGYDHGFPTIIWNNTAGDPS
jgi:hypothetical protein